MQNKEVLMSSKEKQVQQLSDLFGLGTEVVENQIKEIAEVIEEFKDNLSEEDAAIAAFQLKELEEELRLNKEQPLAEQVYEALLAEMGAANLTKVLEVMTSPQYDQLFQVLENTLVAHSTKVIDYIDNMIELEEKKEEKSLH